MIEVEKRTFIDKNKYEELVKNYFNNVESEMQITTYFDVEQDFRLMETTKYTQLWIKDGKIHDAFREESVVKIDNQYKNDLLKMLDMLKYKTDIVWYRERKMIEYKDLCLCLDYTEGYGYIFEVEKCVEKEENIEHATNEIVDFFNSNNIQICEKSVFKDKYEDYKKNWRDYTKNIDKNKYIR